MYLCYGLVTVPNWRFHQYRKQHWDVGNVLNTRYQNTVTCLGKKHTLLFIHRGEKSNISTQSTLLLDSLVVYLLVLMKQTMLSLKPQEHLRRKSAISFRITFEGDVSEVAEVLGNVTTAPSVFAEHRGESVRPLLLATQGGLPFQDKRLWDCGFLLLLVELTDHIRHCDDREISRWQPEPGTPKNSGNRPLAALRASVKLSIA